MTLEAVPCTTPRAAATPALGAQTIPMREDFSCQRGERRIVISPRYGEGARSVQVRYLWSGAPGAPSVIVQGGISADRDVCANAGHAGWWSQLVGAGKAIDLQQHRVLSIDWIGAGELGVPAVSSEDQADVLAALLDDLRISRVKAFVGASYGAMVGLAFASRHAHRLHRLVALAGAHRPHPLSTAQRAIQRGILRLGLQTGAVDQAVSLSRQLAMTTYRGADEFAQRFQGAPDFRDGRYRLPVEDWLEHNGNRFVGRFDAERYLSLSESIDLHAVDPAAVRVPSTLIGFASDRLVPLADLCELQRQLGGLAALEVVDSRHGHDGFLKEHARLAPLLREALNGNGD